MSATDDGALKQLRSDYEFVFGSEEGGRVLKHIIETCCVLEPSFDLEGRIENTFYNEGRRSVALMALKMLGRNSVNLTTPME